MAETQAKIFRAMRYPCARRAQPVSLRTRHLSRPNCPARGRDSSRRNTSIADLTAMRCRCARRVLRSVGASRGGLRLQPPTPPTPR
eukprot:771111-Prymnesium_polylepis.1